MALGNEVAASLVGRLERLPVSPWHRRLLSVAFFGIVFDAADFAIFGAALPSIRQVGWRGRATVTMAAGFPLGLAYALGVLPAVLLLLFRRNVPESVRYLLARGRREEARRTVEAIEVAALGTSLRAVDGVAAASPPPARGGLTVLMLLREGRGRRTLLLWLVSIAYLWASNGILFMLPTILTQRGLPLTQAIGVAAYFITAWATLAVGIETRGRQLEEITGSIEGARA